jgi:subtilisin family serine protease
MGRTLALGLGLTVFAAACGPLVTPPLRSGSPVLPPVSAQGGRTNVAEAIVKLAPGVKAASFALQHRLMIKRTIGLGMVVLAGKIDLTALRRDRQVTWAEADRELTLPKLDTQPAPSRVPARRNAGANDPLLAAQYGVAITNTDKAWATQAGSAEVIVAVIDSGIDGSHPEFAGQLLPGWDLTGKEPAPGGNVDGYGHGTHIAGVIGAKMNNGIGIAGVAPGCKLLPVRIFNEFGHSTAGVSSAAIIWAVDHGAKVINCSWGSPMQSEADTAALKYAADHDVTVVAAVGNAGTNDPKWPGADDSVIGVAATTDIDTWGSFSTWGDWVDLAAPGEGILSTFPMAKGNGYRIMRGTSMAAPFVTAAAALVRSQFPGWNRAQVRERLEQTAKDVIQSGKDPYAGFGRVDMAKAIQAGR